MAIAKMHLVRICINANSNMKRRSFLAKTEDAQLLGIVLMKVSPKRGVIFGLLAQKLPLLEFACRRILAWDI